MSAPCRQIRSYPEKQGFFCFVLFLASRFHQFLPKHPASPNHGHLPPFPYCTTTLSTSYTWPSAPPIPCFWAVSFTSSIVGLGGTSQSLMLFQTHNYRFYYPLYPLYVSIHSLYALFMYVSAFPPGLEIPQEQQLCFIFRFLVPSTLLLY